VILQAALAVLAVAVPGPAHVALAVVGAAAGRR
jgi:hypothetical protein